MAQHEDDRGKHDTLGEPKDSRGSDREKSSRSKADNGSKDDPTGDRPLTTREQQESGTAAGPETS